MSQNYKEEWGRRSWYLLRSLIDKESLLSPIPESQEPPIEPPSPTDIALSRPYSPLPELIIEKEPNPHDEPEEFYEALEKRMMLVYRKVFCDTEQVAEYSGSEDADRWLSVPTESEHFAGEIESEDSNDRSSDHQVSDACLNSTEKERAEDEENDIVTENTSTTSLEPHDNEVIVTQAQVHYAGGEEVDTNTHESSNLESLRAGYDEHDHTETESIASVTATEDNDEQSKHDLTAAESEDSSDLDRELDVASSFNDEEVVSKFRRCSPAPDSSSSPDEPEVMRRRKSNRFESINTVADRSDSSDLNTERNVEIASARELEEAQEPSPTSFQGTTSEELSNHESRKSPKRMLDDENESIHQQTKKPCFRGKVRVFRLCSCPNHVC